MFCVGLLFANINWKKTRYFQKVLLCDILIIVPAGFEPALPKESDLESDALDHSAIEPLYYFLGQLRDTLGFCI